MSKRDASGDETYTPAYVIECVRTALGGEIDFDPCTSAEANKVVDASVWMDIEADCLKQDWISERAFKRAVRFFMNPPYSKPGPFIERFFRVGTS